MKPLALPAAAVGLLAVGVRADVLYSNFGPGDAYLTNIGETLSFGGPLGGDAFEHAVPFTVTGGDYYMDAAEVAILHFFGPDLVFADLRADAGGSPGGVLETAAGRGTALPDVLSPPMVIEFSGGVLLENGRTYWLALRTDRTDALLAWAHNAVEDFGLRAWRVNEGAWHPVLGDPNTDTDRAVFRINATPVPGPSGVIAVAAAAGFVGRRRRG